MDRNGQKLTETDRNRKNCLKQKQKNRQKQTEMDRNKQKQAETKRKRQKRTKKTIKNVLYHVSYVSP